MIFISIEFNSGYNSTYFKHESYISVENINHTKAMYNYGYYYSDTYYANISFDVISSGNDMFVLMPAPGWTKIVSGGKTISTDINMKVWNRVL